jgi:hypothetical protein
MDFTLMWHLLALYPGEWSYGRARGRFRGVAGCVRGVVRIVGSAEQRGSDSEKAGRRTSLSPRHHHIAVIAAMS